MRIGKIKLNFIYQILVGLLIVSIWAFNEEKYITYPIKILFIVVFGFYWLFNSRGKISKYQCWCLIMCMLSVLASMIASDSNVAIYTLINVLQVYFIAFVLNGFINERSQVIDYFKFIVFGGLILFVRLVIVTPVSVWTNFARLGGAIGYNANDVGNKAAIAAIIALCLIRSKEKINKKLYVIAFILMLTVVLFSGSRKALIAVVCALILICTIGLENKRNVIFTIIGLIIALYAFYKLIMINDGLYQTIGRRIESMINVAFYGASEKTSIDLREKYMRLAWSYIKDSPILGIGLGNFAVKSGLGIYCHCDYLEVMCSYGIPIAIVYYIPFISAFVKSCFPKNKSIMDYSIIIICFILLISFITMVMYISAYTHIIIAIIFAYLRIETSQYKYYVNQYSREENG